MYMIGIFLVLGSIVCVDSSIFRVGLCYMILWSSAKMVFCFPSTPKKLAMTVGCFIAGAGLFVVGTYLSYVNVAPQQARIKARNDFVKERLRKKYGKP